MFSIKPVKLSLQGLLLLLAFHGGFRATAFVTPLSTCQSAKFAAQQHPLVRELRPAPKSGLCSQLPIQKPVRKPNSQAALFGRHQQEDGPTTSNNNPLVRLRKLLQFRAWYTALSRANRQVKRAAMLVMASAMIWFGTAGSYTPPASASAVERLMPSSNHQIIDRYVKQHIFDDDDAGQQDPLEAAYREAYEDYKVSGAHPRALKEVTTEVLGQGAGKKLMQSEEGGGDNLGLFGVVKGAVKLLERRAGLSETTALTVAAVALVVTVPTSTLLLGTIVSGMSRRSMNKLMKSRYGDTYTLDATIKEEPDVEAPDDDDDDDDDDDE